MSGRFRLAAVALVSAAALLATSAPAVASEPESSGESASLATPSPDADSAVVAPVGRAGTVVGQRRSPRVLPERPVPGGVSESRRGEDPDEPRVELTDLDPVADRDPAVALTGQGGSATPSATTVGGAGAKTASSLSVQSEVVGGDCCASYRSPTWESRDPSGELGLEAFESPSMVFDPIRNETVLFGGVAWNGPTDGTYVFDGTRWTFRTPAASPSARYGAHMAWHAGTGKVVLFGGTNGTTRFNDTWTWNGTTWTQLTPATSPSARSAGAIAELPAAGQLVLFGGFGTVALGDTWTFNGTTWAQLSLSGVPGVRSNAAMAYDASSGKIVMNGGANPSLTFSDTWTFSAGAWTYSSTPGPGALSGHVAAYDAALRRVVVHGGYSPTSSTVSVHSWVFNGTSWGHLEAPMAPAVRYNAAMARTPRSGQLVLVGGTDGTYRRYGTAVFDWPRSGAQRGYKLEEQQLSDRLGLAVNVGGGNLLVEAQDLFVPGVGVPLSMNRYYNSQSGMHAFSKGYGWFFGTGEDLWLQLQPDGSRLLVGFDDSTSGGAYFRNDSGVYATPPGIDADLKNVGGVFELTYRGSGRKQTFATNGDLTKDVDRNGNGLTFAYSSPHLLSTITDAAGRTVTYAYANGFLASITDSAGRSVQYGYTNGFLTSVTDANGKVTGYSYDATTGLLISITSPGGRVTKLTVDNRSRLTGITRVTDVPAGTGPTTSYTYSRPLTTDGEAIWRTLSVAPKYTGTTTGTTYVTNSVSQASKVTDPLGHSRSATYNANASVVTAVDAMTAANTTTNAFDTDNRATGSTAPTGAQSALTYGEPTGLVTNPVAHWQPDTSTDPDGNRTSLTYDTFGNITRAQSTTPDQNGQPTAGADSTYTYNPAAPAAALCGGKPGQACTATDGRGKITSYTYDTLGQSTAVNNPAPLGDTSATYDTKGRTATSTDGKSTVTRYTYDELDRTTQVRIGTTTCTTSDVAAGSCLTYTYDDDGNRLSQTDQTGTTSYLYDPLNRETQRTLPGSAPQGGAFKMTHDANGNLASTEDPGGITSYSYDAANQLTRLAEPGGSCSGSGQSAGCTWFGYNENGFRTSTTYPTTPATVMTATPDASGRISRIKYVAGTTTHSDFAYTYSRSVGTTATDGVLTRTRTDHTAGLTTSYGYDDRAQLLSAVEKNTGGTTTGSWTYGYDLAGNRTSASLSGTPGAPVTTFGYNDANQLTSRNGSNTGFAYDANGNETAAIGATTRTAGTWNNKDQLTAVTAAGATHTFAYTGLSQNTRLTVNNIGQRNTATGITGIGTGIGTAPTIYIREPGGTLIGRGGYGTTAYYLFDNQGSVVGLVNISGQKINSYSYDPYGISRSKTETLANPFQYTGGHLDAQTGLYKLGIRYYDPTLGRFTQPDPTGLDEHYGYAGNSPCNFTDPSGALFSDRTNCIFAIFGLGLSIAAMVPALAAGPPGVIAVLAAYGVSAQGVLGSCYDDDGDPVL
ncbi:MAG: repeat protein [Frankiales bacterium]|jgi:RHS repeat-associated protein|nr:repeat protein [Frankiales bacterium]